MSDEEKLPDDGVTVGKRQIADAVVSLNPSEDAHWTKDGLPDANALTEMLGYKIKREDIEAATPGYTRPSPDKQPPPKPAQFEPFGDWTGADGEARKECLRQEREVFIDKFNEIDALLAKAHRKSGALNDIAANIKSYFNEIRRG